MEEHWIKLNHFEKLSSAALRLNYLPRGEGKPPKVSKQQDVISLYESRQQEKAVVVETDSRIQSTLSRSESSELLGHTKIKG